jgi:NAD dependent epimerase/dehydratase
MDESPPATWQGRRVLVTGAAGFIGSHLAEALARAGASVRAFVRYNSRNDHGWLESCDPELATQIEIFRGDLGNPEAVADYIKGCDYVLHLGALIPIPYSYRHPREFVLTNTIGTLNLLEARRRGTVSRLVHVSTSEVYGTPTDVPVRETHALNAQSPYAASKIGADQLALSYQSSFDLPVVIARPFNTYGPRQSARAVIPTIITRALTRDEIHLGSLEPTRDLLYVDDTVRGLMLCAEADRVAGEVINLGTGTEISVAEIAKLVVDELGIDKPIRSSEERKRPVRSEVQRLLADATKARLVLEWSPSVPLAEGLKKTIDWFRRSLHAYKPSIYNV